MTLRWADGTGADERIKSTALWSPKEVSVTKGSDTGKVFLCAQGNNGGADWIWAKEVSGNVGDKTIFLADDIRQGADLSNCKIWLETTDDGLTYAKQPKEGHVVNITAGADSGLEITSGNGRQSVAKSSPIAEIKVALKENYYLSDKDAFIERINQDLSESGLSASPTDEGFTIAGTPNRDVQNVLPAATAHVHSWTYKLKSDSTDTIEATCTSTGGACTVNNGNGGSVKLNPPQGKAR